MVLYLYTVAFYGLRVSKVDTSTLASKVDRSWILEDTRDAFIASPRSIYHFPNFSAIITKHERQKGFVSLQDFVDLSGRPSDFFIPTEEELKVLKELESVACNELCAWVVQYSWSLLTGISQLHFQFMLKIM